MLRFVQVGMWCVVTFIAALICCLEFAAVEFWLLEPGSDGFVGMGILILMLLGLTLPFLVPVSLFWLRQVLLRDTDPEAWWKRTLGLVLVLAFVLLALVRMQAFPVKLIRVLGWVLSWSLILFQLSPLRKRFWGIL